MFTLTTAAGSLDDLVFEGRNREYGAYELRLHYGQRLRQALLMGLALCLLLLLIPLVMRQFDAAAPIVLPGTDGTVTLLDVRPDLPDLKPAQAAAPPAAAAPAVTVRPHSDIATRVAPDEQVAPIAPTVAALPQDVGPSGPAPGATPNPTGASVGGLGKGPGPAADSAVPAAPAAPALYAEVMPSFVGGQAAMQKYLQKHLRFPGAAAANLISGRVYVSFVVQTDGSIADVQVLKDLGYGTGEAAARVVREMPAWLPGLQNKRAVPVRFTLPITFAYE